MLCFYDSSGLPGHILHGGGVFFSLHGVHLSIREPQAEQRCLQMVQQNKVDGIIGLTYTPELKVDPNLPYVSIDRHFSRDVPCVASDNFGGGQLAQTAWASAEKNGVVMSGRIRAAE